MKHHPLTRCGVKIAKLVATTIPFCWILLLGQPAIQITSPSSGAEVNIGQEFNVTVSIADGSTFASVFVILQGVDISSPLTNGPFTFSFVAPPFIGPRTITAAGLDASGNLTFSSPVLIYVETSSSPVSITVTPSPMLFSFAGQQVPLIVNGTFPDGTTADITRSSHINYVSADATVAQVTADGAVTAVGLESATTTQITIAYNNVTKVISVRVPKAIRGDLNGDGKVDQDDLNIILSALNTPATKPVDARDLNGDGVINALDARILVTLCTKPGCATH